MFYVFLKYFLPKNIKMCTISLLVPMFTVLNKSTHFIFNVYYVYYFNIKVN